MEENSDLLWDEIKSHISPPEVNYYAKKVGFARIARNEEIYRELSLLRKMHNTVQANLNEEIEKKTPSVLVTPQRTSAIQKSVHFLDNLRKQGHFVETDNLQDKEIIKYLKLTRMDRPKSSSPMTPTRSQRASTPISSRSVDDLDSSIEEVQQLLDEEYEQIQTEINAVRCSMFTVCEDLSEAKAVQPPSTDSIEAFNRRLSQQEFTFNSMAKQKGSSVNRLRASVQLNRMWD